MFRSLFITGLIILILCLIQVPSLYSDEVSTEAVQKMVLTGSVVKDKDKETDMNMDEESDEGHIKKININTADIEALKKLPGVGPVIAKRIIEYRKTHGRFNTIEEIRNVKGIGEKKFKEIKGMITMKEVPSKKKTVTEEEEE